MEKKSNLTMHHQIRKASNTLETEKNVHFPSNHCPSQLKESNTSTSVGGEPEIKFNRRIKKFRERTEQKVTQSQKHSMFSDGHHLLSGQQKPRFYQNIDISQE